MFPVAFNWRCIQRHLSLLVLRPVRPSSLVGRNSDWQCCSWFWMYNISLSCIKLIFVLLCFTRLNFYETVACNMNVVHTWKLFVLLQFMWIVIRGVNGPERPSGWHLFLPPERRSCSVLTNCYRNAVQPTEQKFSSGPRCSSATSHRRTLLGSVLLFTYIYWYLCAVISSKATTNNTQHHIQTIS